MVYTVLRCCLAYNSGNRHRWSLLTHRLHRMCAAPANIQVSQFLSANWNLQGPLCFHSRPSIWGNLAEVNSSSWPISARVQVTTLRGKTSCVTWMNTMSESLVAFSMCCFKSSVICTTVLSHLLYLISHCFQYVVSCKPFWENGKRCWQYRVNEVLSFLWAYLNRNVMYQRKGTIQGQFVLFSTVWWAVRALKQPRWTSSLQTGTQNPMMPSPQLSSRVFNIPVADQSSDITQCC